MKVDRIYTRNIVTTLRTDTIQEAAETMRRFHVGSLLVTEKGGAHPDVVGIVTDRDLVLYALAEGLDASLVPVDRVMTPVVATMTAEGDALEALERMRAAGVRRLLVTASATGDPVGILSLDDIVDGLAAELASAASLLKSEIRREAATYGGRPRPGGGGTQGATR